MFFKSGILLITSLFVSFLSEAQDLIAEKLGNDSYVLGYYQYHNKVVFQAYADDCFQMAITDGTVQGTHYLKAINNASTPSFPFFLEDKFFFIGYDEQFGRVVWESDGTAAGTIRNTIIPNTSNLFTNFNTDLIFTSNYNRELWISNGTPEGTNRLKEFSGLLIDEITPSSNGVFVRVKKSYPSGFEYWYYNKTTGDVLKCGSVENYYMFGTVGVLNESLYYMFDFVLYKIDAAGSEPAVIKNTSELFITGSTVQNKHIVLWSFRRIILWI